MKTGTSYPGFNKFSDEGGEAINGNLIYYFDPGVSSQYDWFTRNPLAQAGLACIYQSIEVFV